MKILVLQLARLGDIYQSWPTLNALKRSGAELHFLTRGAFASAAPSFIDRHWILDAKSILKPVVDERPDINESLTRLNELVEGLRAEQFDRVINLSYSPFAASLVAELSRESKMEVVGYTRHSDRTLAIPDDSSAYFYAQVGVDKGANRVHLIDLFAYTAGVELTEQDFEFASSAAPCPIVKEAGRGGIVIHVGASTLAKTLSWSKWLQVVKGLLTKSDRPVILVGSRDEMEIAEKVSGIFGPRKPLNLVGRTNLNELFAVIDGAALVIGGDSAPAQIATLVDTPVLNLSFPMVSLWETGPRSAGSRILPLDSEDSYTSDEIVREAISMLEGQAPMLPVIRVPGRMLPYVETSVQPRSFEWELIRALYMGELFPPSPSSTFSIGVQRLEEVNLLALEQIEAIAKNHKNQTASLILDRVDDVMEHIVQLVPEVAPIVRWFRVERLRFGPMSVEALVEATRDVHQRLSEVLGLYVRGGESSENLIMDKK